MGGALPAALGELAALNELWLYGNCFTGGVPCAALARLTALQRLDLSLNALRGAISPELAALTALQDLWLDGNALDPGQRETVCALLPACTGRMGGGGAEIAPDESRSAG